MLKNPQHLWHFLDLLLSLKTRRKSFLAVEKDNVGAHFWHFSNLFLDSTQSDFIFCC